MIVFCWLVLVCYFCSLWRWYFSWIWVGKGLFCWVWCLLCSDDVGSFVFWFELFIVERSEGIFDISRNLSIIVIFCYEICRRDVIEISLLVWDEYFWLVWVYVGEVVWFGMFMFIFLGIVIVLSGVVGIYYIYGVGVELWWLLVVDFLMVEVLGVGLL